MMYIVDPHPDRVDPFTASHDYAIFFKKFYYHITDFKHVKDKTWYQAEKWLTTILSNLNNFPSLEVVNRVSETQLQVGENSN